MQDLRRREQNMVTGRIWSRRVKFVGARCLRTKAKWTPPTDREWRGTLVRAFGRRALARKIRRLLPAVFYLLDFAHDSPIEGEDYDGRLISKGIVKATKQAANWVKAMVTKIMMAKGKKMRARSDRIIKMRVMVDAIARSKPSSMTHGLWEYWINDRVMEGKLSLIPTFSKCGK